MKDAAGQQLMDLASGPLDHAVTAILEFLDPALDADADVVGAVTELCGQLAAEAPAA